MVVQIVKLLLLLFHKIMVWSLVWTDPDPEHRFQMKDD